jgi:hypothetical protein
MFLFFTAATTIFKTTANATTANSTATANVSATTGIITFSLLSFLLLLLSPSSPSSFFLFPLALFSHYFLFSHFPLS